MPSPLSITTPPQTPRSQDGSQAGSQQAGVAVGAVPASAKRDSAAIEEMGEKSDDPQAKRRRIAPTLVSETPK